MDERQAEAIWSEIWTLLEEGKSDQAAARALDAMNESEGLPDFQYLLGISLLDLDEVDAAVRELEAAAQRAPDWAEAQASLAWAYFRCCRFEEAAKSAAAAIAIDPELPEAHQLRGLLAERKGEEANALLEFAEARRIDPERFPDPVEVSEEDFLALAKSAVSELDDTVRGILEQTAIFVQPFPSEELLKDSDPPLDPQLLGLFVGRSLLEQSVLDSGMLPNTMYLFQKNLQRAGSSESELADEIRITVLHEIGHHLGWDEEELQARGLA